MSKVLIRYIAKEVIAASAIVMLAFLGLFAFFDFVNELDDIGQDGYEMHHALLYVALIVPGRVYELLPIVVLIATLYALTTLSKNSEITVMRASGLSTRGLMSILGGVGLIFVALTFVFGEFVMPPSERTAQQWRLTATGSAVSSQLRSGLWVKDGDRFINVQTVRPDRTMEDVRVFEFGEGHSLVSVSDAAYGEYDSDEGIWRMTGIVQTLFLEDRTEVVDLDALDWRSDLSPDVLSVLIVPPDRMSASHLSAYIGHLKDNRQDAHRFEIAFWKKIVYPLSVLVMMALAVPFALSHHRMSAVSVKVFLGVMLGVGFYLLNGLFSNLGVINAWPPILAAMTPSLVFLGAALMMLWRVERR